MLNKNTDKNPSAFMEGLRKALIKHTSLSTNTIKYRFITQTAPNIIKKLQKQTLSKNLSDFSHPQVKTLLHINSTLLCAPTKDVSKKKKNTEILLNFFTEREYKVSKSII